MYDAADLKTRLGALRSAYAATRSAATAAAVRWEMTDAHRYDLRPYYFELNVQRRGQPVEDFASYRSYFRNGIDASGRVNVESYYIDNALVVELFWRYTPNFAEGVVYYKERPTEIIHVRFDNGRPISYRHFDSRKTGRYTQERYTYESDHLARITRRLETMDGVAEYDYLLNHSADGTLERIAARPNTGALTFGGPPIIFQRREAHYHPPAAGHDFGKDLVAAIVRALAARDIREPVCAVVLNYKRDLYCPPLIYVLTERERRERVMYGETSLRVLWLPNLDKPIEVTVPDSVCGMFENLPDEDALALLDAIAYELTVAEWTGVMPETYDFVAFALDFDRGSAVERIYAAAPAGKIRLLQDGGWVY